MSTVAVLIPAYNTVQYIRDTLRSVATQTRLPEQVVIVDDGSTDGTVEAALVAAKDLGLKVEVLRQRNGGVAAARNAGLARVRTDLVAPLDADDLMLPNHLSSLTRPFDVYADLAICFGDCEVLDESGSVCKNSLTSDAVAQLPCDEGPDGLRLIRGSPFKNLIRRTFVALQCACVISVVAWKQARGHDESILLSPDRGFVMRLSRVGRFAYLPKIVGRYRQRPGSLSATGRLERARNVFAMLSHIRSEAADLRLDEEERTELDRAIQSTMRALTYHASYGGISAYLRETRQAREICGDSPTLRLKDMARATLYSTLRRRQR